MPTAVHCPAQAILLWAKASMHVIELICRTATNPPRMAQSLGSIKSWSASEEKFSEIQLRLCVLQAGIMYLGVRCSIAKTKGDLVTGLRGW